MLGVAGHIESDIFEGGFCATLFKTARKWLILNGEMSEWSIEHAWKACVGETLPWVRIPLSPYQFSVNGRPVRFRAPGLNFDTKRSISLDRQPSGQASSTRSKRENRHEFPKDQLDRCRACSRLRACRADDRRASSTGRGAGSAAGCAGSRG